MPEPGDRRAERGVVDFADRDPGVVGRGGVGEIDDRVLEGVGAHAPVAERARVVAAEGDARDRAEPGEGDAGEPRASRVPDPAARVAVDPIVQVWGDVDLEAGERVEGEGGGPRLECEIEPVQESSLLDENELRRRYGRHRQGGDEKQRQPLLHGGLLTLTTRVDDSVPSPTSVRWHTSHESCLMPALSMRSDGAFTVPSEERDR